VYEGVDVLAISLLKSMLIDDPKERITAVDALRHPYFNGQLY
jgi:serine/threonine protein kinase